MMVPHAVLQAGSARLLRACGYGQQHEWNPCVPGTCLALFLVKFHEVN